MWVTHFGKGCEQGGRWSNESGKCDVRYVQKQVAIIWWHMSGILKTALTKKRLLYSN